jgi:hypothetical protein
LVQRLSAAPNGTAIRRACFLWEWLTGQALPIVASPSGGYIDLFPSDRYITAATLANNPKYRVRDNALGTADFCPTVPRAALPVVPSLGDLLAEARRTLAAVTDPSLYERALGTSVPVSAVILKHTDEYLDVLTGFSRPVTRLWNYLRGHVEPLVTRAPGGRAYRYFDAGREVAFTHKMIQLAVEDEIPRELAWLRGFDRALRQLEAAFDLPQKDISALIRMIYTNAGTLSAHLRKQYAHLPPWVLDQIEALVRKAFDPDVGQQLKVEKAPATPWASRMPVQGPANPE